MTRYEGLVGSERHGTVEVLAFNRPEKLNAWTDGLEDEYFDRLRRADADPEVRVIVVTGVGRAFCAGADIGELERLRADGVPEPERQRRRDFPLSVRKPVIAAINGVAAGLGLVHALYCDIRFGDETTRCVTSFAERGLVAEFGSSWLLPRIVGSSRARDLLLSARMVDSGEALTIGLIDFLAPPGTTAVEAALAYAEDLALRCSPRSMAQIKTQLDYHSSTTYDEAFKESDVLMLESFAGDDLAEGIASFRQRRPPRFSPLA